MRFYLFMLIVGVFVVVTACHDQERGATEQIDKSVAKSQFDFPDSLSSRRVAFALDLKRSVGDKAWPDFGTKKTEGALIYFDGDESEVFFPDSSVLSSLEEYQLYGEDYLVTERTDSFPYHMEVMISFDSADASQFYYENPVEQYSSVEEIGNYIPVESTEMWATMVAHEMFHHYQYNNENYREYAQSEIGILPFSIRDLISMCTEDEEFLPMIQNENEYLMQAIAAEEESSRDSLIMEYLSARKIRIDKYSVQHTDLEKVENYYVLQEGSARYIEYHSMFVLSDLANSSDSARVLDDPMFKSYSEFKEIDLDDPAFSYLTYAAASDYHYTIGFNTMRLLDVLGVNYKPDLLNDPAKGLNEYLADYIDSLPGGE